MFDKAVEAFRPEFLEKLPKVLDLAFGFLEFYSAFGSAGLRNSRKSCKYEGGKLNY